MNNWISQNVETNKIQQMNQQFQQQIAGKTAIKLHLDQNQAQNHEWGSKPFDDSDINNNNNQSQSYSDSDHYSGNDDFDIYDYISHPNPILKRQEQPQYNIITANKIIFKKLPSFFEDLRSNKTEQICSQQNDNDKLFQSTVSQHQKQINDNGLINTIKTIQDSLSTAQQSQQSYQIDSQNSIAPPINKQFLNEYLKNKRCVYRKYKEQNYSKYFATYLCDLKNILKKNPNSQCLNKQSFEEQSLPQDYIYNQQQQQLYKKDIIFESNFESGNLFSAYQINDHEYDLVLQNDINTKGNTQWFFFSVTAIVKEPCSYKFNIINNIKKGSLFNLGMRPAVYSVHRHEVEGIGWTRGGYNINYVKGDILREGSDNKTYYTLSFNYDFLYENDTIFFAYSFPYSYSDLNHYLENLTKDPIRGMNVTRRVICKTISKNNYDQVTITSNSIYKRDKRLGVVFMARQHPGETTGSYMIEGVMDYLTENTQEAQFLRENCVVKIFPMVNVDGVIHGNNRCSLAGSDLNRRWKNPIKKLHPGIYHTKNIIKKFALQREIKLLVDFHGHSKKVNAFFYGNNSIRNPEKTRLFPLLASKLCDKINYSQCRFKMDKSFESTARQALWRMLRIPNIFTLEASFFGYKSGTDTDSQKIKEFTPQDYKNIGRQVCICLQHIIKEEQQQRAYQHENQQKNTDNLMFSQASSYERRQNRNNSLYSPYQVAAPSSFGNVNQNYRALSQSSRDNNYSTQHSNSSNIEQRYYNSQQEQSESWRPQSLMQQLQEDLMQQLQKEKEGINKEQEDSDSLSDSQPSEDELDDDVMQNLLPKNLNKKCKKVKKNVDKKLKTITKQFCFSLKKCRLLKEKQTTNQANSSSEEGSFQREPVMQVLPQQQNPTHKQQPSISLQISVEQKHNQILKDSLALNKANFTKKNKELSVDQRTHLQNQDSEQNQKKEGINLPHKKSINALLSISQKINETTTTTVDQSSQTDSEITQFSSSCLQQQQFQQQQIPQHDSISDESYYKTLSFSRNLLDKSYFPCCKQSSRYSKCVMQMQHQNLMNTSAACGNNTFHPSAMKNQLLSDTLWTNNFVRNSLQLEDQNHLKQGNIQEMSTSKGKKKRQCFLVTGKRMIDNLETGNKLNKKDQGCQTVDLQSNMNYYNKLSARKEVMHNSLDVQQNLQSNLIITNEGDQLRLNTQGNQRDQNCEQQLQQQQQQQLNSSSPELDATKNKQILDSKPEQQQFQQLKKLFNFDQALREKLFSKKVTQLTQQAYSFRQTDRGSQIKESNQDIYSHTNYYPTLRPSNGGLNWGRNQRIISHTLKTSQPVASENDENTQLNITTVREKSISKEFGINGQKQQLYKIRKQTIPIPNLHLI